MEERHCHISSVLSDVEVDLLRGLFRSVGRDGPDSRIIARIDPSKPHGSFDCPFKYGWGYDYYCCNPDRIKKEFPGKVAKE